MKYLKACLHFLFYTAIIKKKEVLLFCADFFIFLILSFNSISGIKANSLSPITLILNVLSFISICFFIYNSKKFIKEMFLTKMPYELDVKDISIPIGLLPSVTDEEKGFCQLVTNNRKFIRSKSVDDYLLECDTKGKTIEFIMIRNYVEKIRNNIRSNYSVYLMFLKRQFNLMALEIRPLINEKKISMLNEPTPDEAIKISKSSYYDFILSNVISRKKITINNYGDEKIFYDGNIIAPYYEINGTKRLQDYAYSEMNNNIGVSVLALSLDKVLSLFYQGKSYIDTTSVVPTGNGSADWKDCKKANGNFINIIKRAMERELKEEALPGENDIKKITVIGYFKWLEMVGKPQFIGIANINIKYFDIRNREGLQKTIDPRKKIFYKIRNKNDLLNAIHELEKRKDLNAGIDYLLFRLKELCIENNPIIEKWIESSL
jgi:hypothetical protein